jgi:hypothetical protein
VPSQWGKCLGCPTLPMAQMKIHSHPNHTSIKMKIFSSLVTYVLLSNILFVQAVDQFLITENSVGPFKIGSYVYEIYDIYGMESIQITDLNTEGGFTPSISIQEFRISALPDCYGKIFQISIFDNRFYTKEGVRVGTTIKQLSELEHLYVRYEDGQFRVYQQNSRINYLLDPFKVIELGINYRPNMKISDLPEIITIYSITINS